LASARDRHFHGRLESTGAKVQGTPQRLSRLDVLALLRDSQRAGVAGLLSDPLGHFAVERPDRVEGEVAAMDRTVRIPGLLQPIHVLPEFNTVRGHAVKTPVEDLFGEHRGRQSAEVLNELAVLIRADRGGTDRLVRHGERGDERLDRLPHGAFDETHVLQTERLGLKPDGRRHPVVAVRGKHRIWTGHPTETQDQDDDPETGDRRTHFSVRHVSVPYLG
jgi:hypothetical protein